MEQCHPAQEIPGHLPVHRDLIFLLMPVCGPHDLIDDIPVVGHQKKAPGILVQPCCRGANGSKAVGKPACRIENKSEQERDVMDKKRQRMQELTELLNRARRAYEQEDREIMSTRNSCSLGTSLVLSRDSMGRSCRSLGSSLSTS